MDVSDGLVQDCGHLCRASGVAAEISSALLPLSDAARGAGAEYLPLCLSGGDDYELLMAVPGEHEAAFQTHAALLGLPVTRIGQFIAGPPTVVVRNSTGAITPIHSGGWSHFG
jgi:thiamine-monophosphate kinase